MMFKYLLILLLATPLWTLAAEKDFSTLDFSSLHDQASQGVSTAQYYLAEKLFSQAMTPQAVKQAEAWYFKAHAAGYVPASLVVISHFYFGIFQPKNFLQAEILAHEILANPHTSPIQSQNVNLYLAGINFHKGNFLKGFQLIKFSVVEIVIFLILVLFIAFYISYQKSKALKVWSLADLALVIALYLFGSFLSVYFSILIATPFTNLSYLVSAMILTGLTIVISIVVFIWLGKLRSDKISDIFRFKKLGFFKFLAWWFFGFLTTIVFQIIYASVAGFFNIPQKSQEITQLFLCENNPWIIAGVCFYGVVIVALIEELLFRGVVHRILKFSPAVTIIFSAVFFAIAHVDLYSLVPLSLIGLVLAFSYYKTQNIFVPIAIHASVNAFAFSSMLALKYFMPIIN